MRNHEQKVSPRKRNVKLHPAAISTHSFIQQRNVTATAASDEELDTIFSETDVSASVNDSVLQSQQLNIKKNHGGSNNNNNNDNHESKANGSAGAQTDTESKDEGTSTSNVHNQLPYSTTTLNVTDQQQRPGSKHDLMYNPTPSPAIELITPAASGLVPSNNTSTSTLLLTSPTQQQTNNLLQNILQRHNASMLSQAILDQQITGQAHAYAAVREIRDPVAALIVHGTENTITAAASVPSSSNVLNNGIVEESSRFVKIPALGGY